MCQKKIVEVKWWDAIGDGGWCSYDYHSNRNMIIHTVGFLVCEDKDSITVSAHISGLESCDNPMRISRVAIVEYYEIEFK